jgi:hypothetical protein
MTGCCLLGTGTGATADTVHISGAPAMLPGAPQAGVGAAELVDEQDSGVVNVLASNGLWSHGTASSSHGSEPHLGQQQQLPLPLPLQHQHQHLGQPADWTAAGGGGNPTCPLAPGRAPWLIQGVPQGSGAASPLAPSLQFTQPAPEEARADVAAATVIAPEGIGGNELVERSGATATATATTAVGAAAPAPAGPNPAQHADVPSGAPAAADTDPQHVLPLRAALPQPGPDVPLAARAGAIFALYCLYGTQLCQPAVRVYVPLALLSSLAETVREAAGVGLRDVVAVVRVRGWAGESGRRFLRIHKTNPPRSRRHLRNTYQSGGRPQSRKLVGWSVGRLGGWAA